MSNNLNYKDNGVSLEYILRTGWVNGTDIVDIIREANVMGYNIDYYEVLDKWEDYDTEFDHYFGEVEFNSWKKRY
jgi:hypothetical protein